MFNNQQLFVLNIKEKWQEYLMGLTLIIGLGSIFLGLWLVVSSPKDETKVVLEQATASSREEIMVEIAGAIENPGTYRIEEGSRVGDLVKRAGGFSKSADTNELALELNLARKLSDEEKIYIKFLIFPQYLQLVIL